VDSGEANANSTSRDSGRRWTDGTSRYAGRAIATPESETSAELLPISLLNASYEQTHPFPAKGAESVRSHFEFRRDAVVHRIGSCGPHKNYDRNWEDRLLYTRRRRTLMCRIYLRAEIPNALYWPAGTHSKWQRRLIIDGRSVGLPDEEIRSSHLKNLYFGLFCRTPLAEVWDSEGAIFPVWWAESTQECGVLSVRFTMEAANLQSVLGPLSGRFALFRKH
jgi:hypothetical protein